MLPNVVSRPQGSVPARTGPDAFEPRSIRGPFSDAMPAERAQELASIMRDSRPVGTRTMALALAEADLRDALRSIGVPTLFVCGDADERPPLSVDCDPPR